MVGRVSLSWIWISFVNPSCLDLLESLNNLISRVSVPSLLPSAKNVWLKLKSPSILNSLIPSRSPEIKSEEFIPAPLKDQYIFVPAGILVVCTVVLRVLPSTMLVLEGFIK